MGDKSWSQSDITQCVVVLGHNDLSSNCLVTIADPNGNDSNKLFNHSLTSGGIVALERPKPVEVPSTPGGSVSVGQQGSVGSTWDAQVDAIIREAIKQGADKAQIAYILATADGESGKGQFMVEMWDGRGLQATYDGRLGNNQPGDGKRYRGRGYIQMTGKERYQYWSRVLGVDLVANPDYLAQREVAVVVLVRAMLRGEATGRKLSQYVRYPDKLDWYNARRTVNGIVPSQVNKYLNLAREYWANIDTLITRATGSTSAPTKVPTPTVPTATTKSTPPLTPTDISKGTVIYITVGNTVYEFIHQGTRYNNRGELTITGQSVRWVMNRRKRNTSHRDITIRQLAGKVAQQHGLTMEYLPKNEYHYQHIEQRGLTDYQLLLREAKELGLSVSEEGRKLVIRELQNTTSVSLVISPGVNLVQYEVQDRAIDSSDSSIDLNLQTEPKQQLDPKTGTIEQRKADIDTKKTSQDTTGKPISNDKGKLSPGSASIATANKSRMKRVKGLPTKLTIVTSTDVLAIRPMSAVRTEGLPGKVLNRVWLVDLITHDLISGTSVLDVVSPIEVVDTKVETNNATVSPGGQLAVTNATGFVFPCSGTVTSGYGIRVHPVTGQRRMHHGIDVGNSSGTPIYAAKEGTVTIAAWQRGYGNVVYISHPDGWQTRYAHLSAFTVRVGQTVTKGQEVGKMGATGVGTGVHLHFEIRKPDGTSVDPSGLFNNSKVGNSISAGSPQR